MTGADVEVVKPRPLAVPGQQPATPGRAPVVAAREPRGPQSFLRYGGGGGAGWQAEIRRWVSGHPADRVGFAANYADLVSLLVSTVPVRVTTSRGGKPAPVAQAPGMETAAQYLAHAAGRIRGTRLTQQELFGAWHRQAFTVGELFVHDNPADPFVFDPVPVHNLDRKAGKCVVRWTEDQSRSGGFWESEIADRELHRSYRSKDGTVDCTSPFANGLVELRGYVLARERLRRISKMPGVARAWVHPDAQLGRNEPDPILEDYYEVGEAAHRDPEDPMFELPLYVRQIGDGPTEMVDLVGGIDLAAMELDRHWASQFAATQSAPNRLITGDEEDVKYLNGVLSDGRTRDRLLLPETGWLYEEISEIAFRPIVARLIAAGLVPGSASDYALAADWAAFDNQKLDPVLVADLWTRGLLDLDGTADLLGVDPDLLLELPEGVSPAQWVLSLRSAGAASAFARGDENAIVPDGGVPSQLPPRPAQRLDAGRAGGFTMSDTTSTVPDVRRDRWWD